MRPIALVLAGVLAGSVGAFVHARLFVDSPVDAPSLSAAVLEDRDASAGTGGSFGHESPLLTARLAQHRAALEIERPDELVSRIQQWSSAPPGPARDAALETWLTRLVEIDPDRAVTAVRQLQLEQRFVAMVYRAWMTLDSAAALRAVRDIDDPAIARRVLVEMLETFGDDDGLLTRIMNAVPNADLPSLRVDRLVLRARVDPPGALQDALHMRDQGMRDRAARRIAAVWARQDPAGALREAALIDDAGIRSSYTAAVMAEWALIDPAAALDHLAYEVGTGLGAGHAGALPILAASDPERMLAVADGLRSAERLRLRQAALQVLVERDPLAVLSLAEALPDGGDRQQLQQLIATHYARHDPERGFAWAVETGSLQLSLRALSAVALDRPLEAVNLALTQPEATTLLMSVFQSLGGPPIISPTSVNPDAMPAVADRLHEAGDRYAEALSSILESWAQVDPDRALRWSLEHGATGDEEALAGLARGFVRGERQPSDEFLPSLPPELRSRWIAEVAQAHAADDADAVLNWLDDFRHEPDYGEWVAAAVEQMVTTQHYDAGAAARLLGSVARPPADTAASVASQWAQEAPEAAGRWALSLADADARSAAAAAAAGAWTIAAPSAAQQWALRQADDALRDRALASVLAQAVASHGVIEPALLSGFSSDAARRQALHDSALALAVLHHRDPGAARGLIDTHFADAAIRSEVERQLERIGNPGRAVPGPETPLLTR